MPKSYVDRARALILLAALLSFLLSVGPRTDMHEREDRTSDEGAKRPAGIS